MNRKNKDNVPNAAKTFKPHHHSLDLWSFWGVLYTSVCQPYLLQQTGEYSRHENYWTQDYFIPDLSTLCHWKYKLEGNTK